MRLPEFCTTDAVKRYISSEVDTDYGYQAEDFYRTSGESSVK